MLSTATVLMQSAGPVDDFLAHDVNIQGTRYHLDQDLSKLRKDNRQLAKIPQLPGVFTVGSLPCGISIGS